MYEQLSIFDIIKPSTTIPAVDKEGRIKSELLVPERWEAWKFSKSDWSLNGNPYIIDAVLVVLPGNRLYVKEWMLYPFMHELKSAEAVDKMYHTIRKKIVEKIEQNNDIQKAWQVNELLKLEDMYWYKDGEYSCKEYAEKMLYGYKCS